MEYKASLDKSGKLITLGVIVLFLIIVFFNITSSASSSEEIGVNTFLIPLFLLSIVVFAYLFSPKSYELTNSAFIIVRPINSKKIELKDVSLVRLLESSELSGVVRTFGVGGLFGYYGKFYASKIGSMMFYTTQNKNFILIETKQGKKIIVTPDDAKLVEELNQKRNALFKN